MTLNTNNNKYLTIANRSRVSCNHNTSRTFRPNYPVTLNYCCWTVPHFGWDAITFLNSNCKHLRDVWPFRSAHVQNLLFLIRSMPALWATMTSYKGLKSCNISLYRKALFVTWLLYYSSMITLSVVTVVATMNKPSITRLSPHTDSLVCSNRILQSSQRSGWS